MRFFLFVYLWLRWLFVAAALELSLVAVSKGRCPVVIHRLPTAVFSLVERGLWGTRAQ